MTRPLDQLAGLARGLATGEFICVTSTAEIHVYLQRGRLAWATDSIHRFAFAVHLQQTANIDVDTFRQTVEECRRERLPLGETLVEWGLASWAQVRASLLNQIRDAIGLVSESDGHAKTLFLQRNFADYREELTFTLDEALRHDEDDRPSRPSFPDGIADRPGLAQDLRRAIDGIDRVAVLDLTEWVDMAPSDVQPWVSQEFVEQTLLDGADFVALRSPVGSVIGLMLSQPSRSLWCRLEGESTFGAILSALWTSLAASESNSRRVATRGDIVPWSTTHSDNGLMLDIQSLLKRAPEVLAVVVLPNDSDEPPLLACGDASLESEYCVSLARRRATALKDWRACDDSEQDGRLEAIGYYLRSLATGEPRLWCFGSELGERAMSLWIFTDRRSSQGLGWAYLASFSRVLGARRPRGSQ